MSSLFKTPSVASSVASEVQEVAPAATNVSRSTPTTTALEEQRKTKRRYNFAATQGSVTSGSQTFGA